MLRLLGALLIFGGACWAGFQADRDLLQKTKNLQQLIFALERMGQELTFRLTPLPELLAVIGEQTEGPVGSFFQNCSRHAQNGDGLFSAAWTQEAQRLGEHLDHRVLDSLVCMGQAIGRYNHEEGRRQISFTVNELKECLAEAKKESRRLGPVYRTLGAGAGAILVILLL